jgi:hypothetical protein
MSLFRKQASFTYCSQQGLQQYFFDVIINTQGQLFVKNIVTSGFGPVSDIPDAVVQDIEIAKGITLEAIGQTQVDQGVILYTGQYSRPVVIPVGVLNNNNYRVVYSVPGGNPPIKTEAKTIIGFNAVSDVPLGTIHIPFAVRYVVLASTHESSAVGGTLTFTSADAGVRSIIFPAPMTTDAYQVILSPNGFFPAQTINQTRQGFQVQIGYTVQLTETVSVGYDVFVR